MPGHRATAAAGAGPRPRARDLRSPLRFLWWLVLGQRRRAALAAVLGTAWMLGLTLPPYVLSRAIDDGLRPGHFSSLLAWAALLLGVGVLNAAVSIWRHRTMTKVRMDGAFRTVTAVVDACTRQGAGLTRRVTAGEVATIGIGDVWTISTSLTVLGPGLGSVIGYAVVAVLLLSISPLLALVTVLGVPALVLLVGPVLGRLLRVGTVYRERQGELTGRLVDIVAGLRVLNGIGGKDASAERYRQQSHALQEEGYRVGSVASWVPALGAGLPVVFLAAVTWLAARLALSGTITVGQLVAVYGYVAVLVIPVQELIWSGSALSQSVVSARRVIALLKQPEDPSRFPGEPAPVAAAELVDPDSGVRVAPGLFTAVATPRLADAVTVLDRLGGYLPGRVTWGGVDLSGVDVVEVRSRLLVAEHESHLFTGTLREVLAGRGEADDESARRAMDEVAAADVVDGLPGGLGGTVTAGGANLSGGQRQRIRLARALLADPEVLLAVEPTSAVDAHTESLIAARLRAGRAGRTTVVATTSPPLLQQADVVHYLVDGVLVDSGRHRELLARRPGYRRLVSRGLGDEPGAVEPGTAEPGTGWPGTKQPGMAEPRMTEPGIDHDDARAER